MKEEKAGSNMRRKLIRRGLAVVALTLVLVPTLFWAWTRLARHSATPEAAALITDSVITPEGWYCFSPEHPNGTGLIFYPGGLVDPAAYAPMMTALADQGITSIVVPMPLDLAVFGIERATEVIAAHPQIGKWIIGGHSLGGVMAAQFVKRHPHSMGGIVFLASYPSDGADLSDLSLSAIAVFASKDGLITNETIQRTRKLMPAGTTEISIDGGNHSQFGNYGTQRGDGQATITREEQQDQTLKAIVVLVKKLNSVANQ
jgi:dienelactone hydrolase